MTKILDKFFSSVLVYDDVNRLDDFYLMDELESFVITPNMINDILHKFKENKATGDDGLHSFILKKNI